MFKLIRFGRNDDIIITSEQLPQAIRCMMSGEIFACSYGIVRGADIREIVPAYRSAMGWNEANEKLHPADMQDFRKKFKHTLENQIQCELKKIDSQIKQI